MKKVFLFVFMMLCFMLAACSKAQAPVDQIGSPEVQNSEPAAQSGSLNADATVATQLWVVVNGTVHSFSGYLLNGEYFFQQDDILAALDNVNQDGAACFEKDGANYCSLEDICLTAGYDFTQDTVLGADYIWTYADSKSSSSFDEELNRAESLGYGEIKADDAVVTYTEFFQMLDHVIELSQPDKLTDWQAQNLEARAAADQMTRLEGMMAVLKCAVTLGDDYLTFSIDWLPLNDKIGVKVWDEVDKVVDAYRYIPNDYPYIGGGFAGNDFSEWDDVSVAYRYSFGKLSAVSGQSIFDYDAEENSMLPNLPLTYNDAMLAALRLYESKSSQSGIITLSDPQAVMCDSTIITNELLERANARPAVSDSNRPLLKGLVFGGDYDLIGFPVSEAEMKQAAQWGFNSVRVMVTYRTFFDEEANTVDLNKLKQLDRLVAAAMRYNLHLNFVTFTVPGRWTHYDSTTFDSVGDFDLFTNTKKQKQVANMWAMFAARYQDVPSAVLSFSPLWEVMNKNLSSGLPVKDYTNKDTAKVFDLLVDTIRKQDPDRLVIYEATPANDAEGIVIDATPTQSLLEEKYSNVMMLTNFCQGPFVYANMTAQEGEHIDNNNHSMFLSDYPAVIYAAQRSIWRDQPMQITGELVKGAKLDLYLSKVWGSGEITIVADGNTLYSEQLTQKSYDVGYPVSGYYPFAKSDKLISITLESDVKQLEICYSGDSFEWSGVTVTLPDSYAIPRWWFETDYDAGLEGRDAEPPSQIMTSEIMICPNSYDTGRFIVISKDLTYTSETIWQQANKDTIDAWAKAISEFAPHSIVRIENANFNACSLDAALAYYNDVYSALNQYGLGWYSNEYINFSNAGRRYMGVTPVNYFDASYCVELLQQLQSFR